MIIRKTVVTYYIQFVLLYVSLLMISVFLVGRGDNFALLSGSADSTRELSLLEILVFVFYQYVLNFPLGLINWFTDRYLFTTYYLIIPNGLTIAWIVTSLLPYSKKSINKLMLYILIPLGIIAFTVISYFFLQSVLGSGMESNAIPEGM